MRRAEMHPRRITNLDAYIDASVVDERIEWLQSFRGKILHRDKEYAEELASLLKLKQDAEDAGMIMWGETLIRDSEFEDHARQLAEDLYGSKLGEAEWPFTCLDWAQAAEDLKQDYYDIDFDGVTYWVRC